MRERQLKLVQSGASVEEAVGSVKLKVGSARAKRLRYIEIVYISDAEMLEHLLGEDVGRGRHPLSAKDLYTPFNEDLLKLLERCKVNYRTWRMVAEVVGCRTRVLRKLRSGETRAVSMAFWDKVVTALGVPHLLEQCLWFTAEDLVALGVWDAPQVLWGQQRLIVEGGGNKKKYGGAAIGIERYKGKRKAGVVSLQDPMNYRQPIGDRKNRKRKNRNRKISQPHQPHSDAA